MMETKTCNFCNGTKVEPGIPGACVWCRDPVGEVIAEDAALRLSRGSISKPNSGVYVSRELTPEMITADPYGLGYGRLQAIWNALLNAGQLAQPADQHIPFPGYPPVPDDRKLPADQQGEPCERCDGTGGIRVSGHSDSCPVCKGSGEIRHAQPATAKVVIPERKEHQAHGLTAFDSEVDGWNACLDEVAKLNAVVEDGKARDA